MGARVLSIQSHVAYGYVGGKVAVFPLQCLGFDVDVVNSVNFSNHSGYGRFGGSRATAQDLNTIFNSMEENGLLMQDRLLTGYIPGAEALSVVSQLARKLKARNPDTIYLLDPVMGDSGKLYVAPQVIPVYRSMLPYATIITPNWFEVETLTDIKLTDLASLRKALAMLHEDYSVPHVVISSMPLQPFLTASLPPHISGGVKAHSGSERYPQYLLCICSSKTSNEERRHDPERLSCVYAHIVPCITGYFSGVGDLFSALTLAHYSPSPSTSAAASSSSLPSSSQHLISEKHTLLSTAVSYAVSKTLAILRLTEALILASTSTSASTSSSLSPIAGSCSGNPSREDSTDEEKDAQDPERIVRRMRARELRLIQGQDILRSTPKFPSTPEGTCTIAKSKGECNAGDALELREMLPWDEFWSSSFSISKS